MAKKMGKTEDYQNYLKRGKYYTQYFDKDINFIRPKMNDGSWRTPYDPIQSIHSVGDFCEGNGWHYTFFVPQHPEGLIELMGGDAPFISKLDSLFLVEGELGENASPDISGLIGMYAMEMSRAIMSLTFIHTPASNGRQPRKFVTSKMCSIPTSRRASSETRIVARCPLGISCLPWDFTK